LAKTELGKESDTMFWKEKIVGIRALNTRVWKKNNFGRKNSGNIFWKNHFWKPILGKSF